MLRAAVVVTFVVAIGLAACGRQVTPSPTFPNLNGRMVIQFTTSGPLDFTDFNYVVVFNTCGIGGEPYPNVFATTFLNYSYSFVVGANNGGFTTLPTLFQYLLVTGTTSLNPHPVPIGPSTAQVSYPYNGQTNTYQLTFLRSQLNNPLGVSMPCPAGGGPTPSPVPTASPSPSPGPTPTATAAGATPTPSAAPSPTPTPNYNVNVWYINFFVIDRSNVVQDSLGGPTDSSQYQFYTDVTQGSQNLITRLAGAAGPSNPSAFITGGEIDNYVGPQ
jgi:hypothetical protein